MSNFFETNLPSQAPTYLVGQELKDKFEAAVASINARTAKLNEALDISCMEPNKFHAVAKAVFLHSAERFDEMSAIELADTCRLLDDGVEVPVKRLEWPNATVLFDTAFTSTKEWESLRHIGIGGSDSAVVMGVSPYTTQRMLFHDKVGTPKAAPIVEDNPVFARGHMTEPKVIEAFCSLTAAKVVPESRMFASKKYPNSTANIDAIVQMPNGKLFIFEAKTAKEDNRKAWLNDKVPRYYLTQTHQYPAVLDDDRIEGTYISCMFCVDYNIGDFFVTALYDEDRNLTRFVERDKIAEEDMLEAEQEYWENYIIPGIEPDPGDPAKELALLEELTGGPAPTVKCLDMSNRLIPDVEEWLEIGEQLSALNKQVDALKDKRDAVKVRLVEALGTEILGRVPLPDNEAYELDYKPTKEYAALDEKKLKKGFTDAYDWVEENMTNYGLLKDKFPEAYNACVTTKSKARVLRVKKVCVPR